MLSATLRLAALLLPLMTGTALHATSLIQSNSGHYATWGPERSPQPLQGPWTFRNDNFGERLPSPAHNPDAIHITLSSCSLSYLTPLIGQHISSDDARQVRSAMPHRIFTPTFQHRTFDHLDARVNFDTDADGNIWGFYCG